MASVDVVTTGQGPGLVVGVAVVVIGVAMHKVFLDVIGGAVVALSAFQWMTRQRGFTGSKGPRR